MATSRILEVTKEIYQQDLIFLNTQTLRGLTGIKKDNTLFVLVNSLIKRGVLKKIEKGKYLVAGKSIDDFALANFLYQPSYLSLESALNLFGILSQFPYEITSVTPRRKREKGVEGKIFVYLHINPQFFWGFEKRKELLIAFPEKALLDTVYFMSKGIRRVDLEELDLGRIDKARLKKFATKYSKNRPFMKLYKVLEKRL